MGLFKSVGVHGSREFYFYIFFTLCLIASISLAYAVSLGLTKQIDNALTLNLNGLVTSSSAFYVQIFSDIGGQYFWIAAVAFFFLRGAKYRRYRRDMALLTFSILLGVALEFIFKAVYFRPRPYLSVAGVNVFTPNPPYDSSFPSGHTIRAFAGSSYLSFRFNRWSPLLYIFAFGVGLSRIYLGVHFPSDVLAGAILGVASSLAALAAETRLWKKPNKT